MGLFLHSNYIQIHLLLMLTAMGETKPAKVMSHIECPHNCDSNYFCDPATQECVPCSFVCVKDEDGNIRSEFCETHCPDIAKKHAIKAKANVKEKELLPETNEVNGENSNLKVKILACVVLTIATIIVSALAVALVVLIFKFKKRNASGYPNSAVKQPFMSSERSQENWRSVSWSRFPESKRISHKWRIHYRKLTKYIPCYSANGKDDRKVETDSKKSSCSVDIDRTDKEPADDDFDQQVVIHKELDNESKINAMEMPKRSEITQTSLSTMSTEKIADKNYGENSLQSKAVARESLSDQPDKIDVEPVLHVEEPSSIAAVNDVASNMAESVATKKSGCHELDAEIEGINSHADVSIHDQSIETSHADDANSVQESDYSFNHVYQEENMSFSSDSFERAESEHLIEARQPESGNHYDGLDEQRYPNHMINNASDDEPLDGAVGYADEAYNEVQPLAGNRDHISLPDDVLQRSYDSDSGAGSIIDPTFRDRSGFHELHHDNNFIYEQLQGIPWVLGYHSQGRSISVYADLDNAEADELHQELCETTHQPWNKFRVKPNNV